MRETASILHADLDSLHAHNHDARPVVTGKRRGSIGAQRALGRGPHARAELDATLAGLVDRVTRRMRSAGRPGRTVLLRLRFDEHDRASLDAALDSIRDRYGSSSVTRGVLIGKDPGPVMPMLPD